MDNRGKRGFIHNSRGNFVQNSFDYGVDSAFHALHSKFVAHFVHDYQHCCPERNQRRIFVNMGRRGNRYDNCHWRFGFDSLQINVVEFFVLYHNFFGEYFLQLEKPFDNKIQRFFDSFGDFQTDFHYSFVFQLDIEFPAKHDRIEEFAGHRKNVVQFDAAARRAEHERRHPSRGRAGQRDAAVRGHRSVHKLRERAPAGRGGEDVDGAVQEIRQRDERVQRIQGPHHRRLLRGNGLQREGFDERKKLLRRGQKRM